MSFQKNGGRTVGRYVLVPNPDTERLVIDAIRAYGDVLQEGERVSVVAYARRVIKNIPAADPRRDEYAVALQRASEIEAHLDIGSGPLAYLEVREFDRATGAELQPASPIAAASEH